MSNAFRLFFLLGPAVVAPAVVCSAAGAPRPDDGVRNAVVASCGTAPVVILGERHRRPGSHELFFDLVETLASRGERLAVGLEIPSDRQAELDAALRGDGASSGIAHPIIDCDSYHQLILGLGKLAARPDRAVTVFAIDAPHPGSRDRDAAMASWVEGALASGAFDRVLVLAGNLHALKQIPWAPGIRHPRETLAELLGARGVEVVSLVQQFPESCAVSAGATFSPSGTPATRTAVDHLWATLNTRPPQRGVSRLLAADGVVSWQCAN